MKKAFTLAEVLITLGIIGIVAAMTLPALVGKYKNKILITAVKKTYSNTSNAIERAKAEQGVFSNEYIFDTTNTSLQSLETLTKYYNGAKICSKVSGSCPSYKIKAKTKKTNVVSGQAEYLETYTVPYAKLTDGSFLRIIQYKSCTPTHTGSKCKTDENGNPISNSSGTDCEKETYQWIGNRCANIIIDTNGFKGPNQYGADVYQIGVMKYNLKEIAGYGSLNSILSADEINYIEYNVPD